MAGTQRRRQADSGHLRRRKQKAHARNGRENEGAGTGERRSNQRGASVKKKARILPRIEGVKSAFFFHNDSKKSMLALYASMITESRRQGWKKSEGFYEYAAQKGKLGTLQKFLDADDCETTTDGKLFNGYKMALADS